MFKQRLPLPFFKTRIQKTKLIDTNFLTLSIALLSRVVCEIATEMVVIFGL